MTERISVEFYCSIGQKTKVTGTNTEMTLYPETSHFGNRRGKFIPKSLQICMGFDPHPQKLRVIVVMKQNKLNLTECTQPYYTHINPINAGQSLALEKNTAQHNVLAGNSRD